MAAEIFTGVDAAWLHIDRPTNLAMIAGVMVLDTPMERARLIDLIHQRLLIYDRFRQRVREPLLGLGLPRWEFDPHFDMDYHVPRVQLPAPGGQVELQKLVGDLMSQPFDRRHPLWQFYYVENYQGGCAIVPRLHHCIADGLALGFIAYPIVKLLAGQGRDVKWLMYVMAVVLVAYFLIVRVQVA